MTQRTVRFAASFFRALDAQFPEARSAYGQSSATDFLVFELPPVRDLLAADMEGNSLLVPPGDDIYAYVGSGVLVWRFVLYLTLAGDGAVEVLDIEVDEVDDEHAEPYE